MIRHSSSHGFAVLICSLASGFMVTLLKEFQPEILGFFSRASIFICTLLNLTHSVESVRLILVSAVMACIWGMAFSLMHK